jgi:hypothetical protein
LSACSSLGLAGLFHPANALRLRPSGISPPKEPRRLFACALPSCRSPSVAHPLPRKRDLWRTRPAFLGAGLVPFAGFTALLPLRVRSVRRSLLTPFAGRAPLGLSPLQGLPARCDATAHHRHSSRVLEPASAPPGYPDGPAACCTTESPSHRWWRRLSRGRLPLLRFLATWSSKFGTRWLWRMVLPRAPGGVAAPCEPSSSPAVPTAASEASVWPTRV